MNFQKIPPVELSKHTLEVAFRKAREKSNAKKIRGDPIHVAKKKASIKVDVVKDSINQRLDKILKAFPETMKLSLFYVQLIKLTIDFKEFKQAFGAINWAIKKNITLQKEYARKIMRAKDVPQIKLFTKQYYGRISSVVKQIDGKLKFLEKSRRILRTYPDIKDLFTICIYGFPNVGKSTLLNKITGTKAKTAAYAFTTKSINAGYATINKHKVQFLDVPGTLARVEKMNNIELQAELVMKELADVIIYVFDLSGYCGYSVKKQEQLLQKIGKKKKTFIVLSKQDILTSEQIKEFPHKHHSFKEIKEQISPLLEAFAKDKAERDAAREAERRSKQP